MIRAGIVRGPLTKTWLFFSAETGFQGWIGLRKRGWMVELILGLMDEHLIGIPRLTHHALSPVTINIHGKGRRKKFC